MTLYQQQDAPDMDYPVFTAKVVTADIIKLYVSTVPVYRFPIHLTRFYLIQTLLSRHVLAVLLALSLLGCSTLVSIPGVPALVSNHRYVHEHDCDFNRSNQVVHWHHKERLNPEGFTMLNWNVYKASHRDWVHDFDRLTVAADIVLLQEAQLHTAFHQGLNTTELHWDLSTAFHYEQAATGVLNGSTVKPGSACLLRANEPIINIPKAALVTEYYLEGQQQTLLVANIHMINFTLGISAYREQMSSLINVLRQHQGPMIVAGDFNTWSQQRQAIVSLMARQLGLQAVTFELDHRLTIFGNTVDHVFYRGLNTMQAYTEAVVTSDHNPMTIRFQLAQPGAI